MRAIQRAVCGTAAILCLVLVLVGAEVRSEHSHHRQASTTYTCGQTTMTPGNTDTGNALYLLASPCTTPAVATTVSGVNFYAGNPSLSTVLVAVAADASGGPGPVLCQASAKLTPSAGINALPIVGCGTLPPTTKVWIEYLTDSNTLQQGAQAGNCAVGSPSIWSTHPLSSAAIPAAFPTANQLAGHGCYELYLSLTAVPPPPPPPVLAPTVSFSTSQNITLSNSGTAALNISSLSFSGPNASSFQQTNTCGSVLGVGASCTITITFTLTGAASGISSAYLVLNDNAPGSPHTVPVTASGTVAITHSVALTWLASPTPGVAYNVYRSGTAGGEARPAVNPAPVVALAYVDPNVAAGQTYYYTVTATLNGLESAMSNEAKVTIPTP